jgi:WD40 repeat protein
VINDVAYSLDGQQIEVKTSTGIYLHSASELVISEFLQQPFPLDAVVAPDGVTIAIRGEDSLVQIQIISDGTSGVTLMNSVRVEPAQFSADSQFLITRADYTAQLWQVDEGIQLFAGQAIAFSLDGSLVAVSEDNVVTVYQLPTMQAIATVIPTETTTEEDESKYDYSRDVRALAFSPDGSQLAVGMNPSGYVVVQGSAVELFRLSDGELLLQMNSIGAVDLPKVFDCNEIYLADPPPPTAVREINFAADGQYMAVSFGEIENGQIRLYSIPDGAVIHTFPPDIQSLAFAPDEPTLVTGSRHGLLQLWQASNGDLLETVAGYGSPIERLVFSPEGKLVAQQTAQDVSLYASENGQLLAQYPTATALTFLSDDNEVIVGYENGLIEWRSLPENNMIYQAYGHDGTVTALAFVLDNDVVVSAGEDCKMQIWNDGELMGILSPYQAESIFDAPDSPVGVATLFSVPGGTTIAGLFSGFPVDYREHGELGFWDIGDGELLAVPDELPDNFEIAAFSPDGRHVAIYDSVDALSFWQFDDHFQFQRQWQQEIFYLSYLPFPSSSFFCG